MRIFAAYTILTLSRVICLSQAVTTTRREFEPLTTVFTPAPECASLTIVHYGRKVLVRTGCVRPDPSCCPPVAPTNTTYSPGICPSGYSTYDAHLGVDRLGIDTKTWEATCIPSGVTRCSTPPRRVPQYPFRDPDCPEPYSSVLPNMTQQITASVFYYDTTLTGWHTEAFRTTTVLSTAWPTLTPDSTAPKAVYAQAIVIRWQEGDFTSTSSNTEFVTPSTAAQPASLTSAIRASEDARSSTLLATSSVCGSCTNSPLETSKPRTNSNKAVVTGVLTSVLGVSSAVFGTLFYCLRKRAKSLPGEIELDDRVPIGCKVLYEARESVFPVSLRTEEQQLRSTRPEIDIVFVHGLRGHRTRTWTKDTCCWPRDLLPKWLPGIRVVTFGYDASVARLTGRPSSNNINKHSAALLLDLQGVRQNSSNRPIIFIAHSLGGLVVKDALQKAREASENSGAKSIFNATHGIIFLGTPHHGSSYASFGRRAARFVKFFQRDTNVNLIRSIEANSEILERISQDFVITLSRRPEINIFSFTEELSMSSLLSPVVPHTSGHMGIEQERTGTIFANHRDMCRFRDERDPGFRRIINVVAEFAAAALKGVVGESRERSTVEEPLVELLVEPEELDITSWRADDP